MQRWTRQSIPLDLIAGSFVLKAERDSPNHPMLEVAGACALIWQADVRKPRN